jgi:apolipoprotein N-acyltransferase
MINFFVGLLWVVLATVGVISLLLIIINLPVLIVMALPFLVVGLVIAAFILGCYWVGKLIRRRHHD